MTCGSLDLPSLERSHSAKTAEDLIEIVSTNFRVKRGVELRKIELPTGGFGVNAVGDNNDSIALGYGKGIHSDIGAFGECIEHFHLWDIRSSQDQHEVEVDCNFTWVDDIFFKAGNSLNKIKGATKVIPHKVLGTSEIAYVPSLMFGYCSSGDKSKLDDHEIFYSRYASSNGSAFGFSYHDALLHAMHEVIERHEISILFLELLSMAPNRCSYDLIDDYSFHPELRPVSGDILLEENISGLTTLVKKTEFDTYFSFSFVYRDTGGRKKLIWGAGCSSYRDLAIYRSLTECQQLLSNNFERVDDRIDVLAKKYRTFSALEHIDLTSLWVNKTQYQQEPAVRVETRQQAETLGQTLRKSGREVLIFRHEPVDCSYSVVTVYITNTEKFYGVIFALPVLPISYLEEWIKQED